MSLYTICSRKTDILSVWCARPNIMKMASGGIAIKGNCVVRVAAEWIVAIDTSGCRQDPSFEIDKRTPSRHYPKVLWDMRY